MRYNLTILLKSDVKDADKKKIVKSIKDDLGKAKITEKEWGEKKLAYPINKQLTGIYINFVADSEEIIPEGFEKNLYNNDKILRHLLLRQ